MLTKLYKKIPYPKLFLLIGTLYLGRMVYTDGNNFYFHSILDVVGYFGTFIAGVLLAYGFTFGPAVGAILYYSQSQNFFVAGLIATLGAIIGNLLIFRLIHVSLEQEIKKLKHSQFFQWSLRQLNKYPPSFIRRYILPIFAGILVATPLPDEIGMAILALCPKLSFPVFSVVTFIFSIFGIFILLAIGKML